MSRKFSVNFLPAMHTRYLFSNSSKVSPQTDIFPRSLLACLLHMPNPIIGESVVCLDTLGKSRCNFQISSCFHRLSNRGYCFWMKQISLNSTDLSLKSHLFSLSPQVVSFNESKNERGFNSGDSFVVMLLVSAYCYQPLKWHVVVCWGFLLEKLFICVYIYT